jgi:hypothetical protein
MSDHEELLFEKSLSLSRVKGGLFVAASCFPFTVFILGVGGESAMTGPMLVYSYVMLFLVFLVPGLVLLIAGLVHLLRIGSIAVTRDEVTYEISRALFGPRYWTERVENYRGVLLDEIHLSAAGDSGTIERRLGLSHDDPCRCVCFDISREDGGATMRNLCRQYAGALSLPALRKDSNGIHELPVSRTVSKTSASQSPREVVYEIDESIVPDKIEVVNCKNSIDIQFDQGTLSVPIIVSMIVTGLGLIVAGIMIHDGVLLVVFGIVLTAFPVLLILIMRFIATRLSISSNSIREMTVYPGGTAILKQLSADHVEDVHIADHFDGWKRGEELELYITSDDGDIVVGRGMPRDTLEWIKECVLCVIAGDNEAE